MRDEQLVCPTIHPSSHCTKQLVLGGLNVITEVKRLTLLGKFTIWHSVNVYFLLCVLSLGKVAKTICERDKYI